jgi:LAO/AO transport system kinase
MPDMLIQLVQKMLGGDRQALARLFSLLERDPGQLPVLMKALHPHTGRAYCVGVTGPPGAGKSTLVNGLIESIRRQGSSVGVLAVDPTSPFTGGAVLGDRIRMKGHVLDEGVFIRSLATRGATGGLSSIVRAAVRLLDAFGEDIVLVESVGVGQTELDVMNVADTVIVTLVPEGGDAVQALKAGLMEIGDVFAVNKADRDGAGRTASAVKVEVRASSKGRWWSPPVLLTQAHKGEGIEALYEAVLEHRHESERSSNLQRRRSERRKLEFTQIVREAIEERVAELEMRSDEFGALVARVENGEVDPYSAAREVLDGGQLYSQIAEARGTSPPRP